MTIPADARIYLRPLDFVDSPQCAGRESERLAGTLIWFAGLEVRWRSAESAKTQYSYVALADWPKLLEGLSDAQKTRASSQFAYLTNARAPLQLGERTIRFDTPHVMGIINCTPDSFSDGGQNEELDIAVAHAVALSSAGASMLDIGGESTRPNAPVIWEGDEIKRVVPLIEKLAGSGIALSVDTRKAAVMEASLAAGAHMINDISALAYDDRALQVAATSGVPVVLMAAPSQGDDPHSGEPYADIVTGIYDFLEDRIAVCEAAGIARGRIIVDPGLGFGYGGAKTLADDLALINELAVFHALGCPIVFGASRKRMIGALAGEAPAQERLGGSLMLAAQAMAHGAQIIRVHDVAETVQLARVWRGLRDAALTKLP